MQLRLVFVALLALAGVAHGDAELIMRGVYYKERATRVVPPMLDGRFDLGEHGQANAHLLVDAITSASVGAFEETRMEGGLGYQHRFLDETLTLGLQGRLSSEPDYTSAFGQLVVAKELADRNFTIRGTVAYGEDEATGVVGMNVREGELKTLLGSLSLSQILSPNMIATVTYDIIGLRGEQANLYRSVIANGMELPEEAPRERLRQAFAGGLKYFVVPTNTAVILQYRYYRDDWDLHAHTPELRLIQDIGGDDVAWFTARYRFHRQSKAYFYERRYPAGEIPEFPSDDPKLAAFDNHTLGAQFETSGEALGLTGRAAVTRAQFVIEYVVSGSDFGNAVVAHAALTVPFEY